MSEFCNRPFMIGDKSMNCSVIMIYTCIAIEVYISWLLIGYSKQYMGMTPNHSCPLIWMFRVPQSRTQFEFEMKSCLLESLIFILKLGFALFICLIGKVYFNIELPQETTINFYSQDVDKSIVFGFHGPVSFLAEFCKCFNFWGMPRRFCYIYDVIFWRYF